MSPDAKAALMLAAGAILRTDGPRAVDLLKSIRPDQLDDRAARVRDCTLARLSLAPDQETAAVGTTAQLVAEVRSLYRTYWQASVAAAGDRQPAENKLRAGLAQMVGLNVATDLDEIEPLLAKRLRGAGLFVQLGKTGLLRDLMLWSSQIERLETVDILGQGRSLKVVYADGFLSRGWSNYLACEALGTGGYATADAIFVVVPGHRDLNDERFRVNFLAHEAQHVLDKRRFPDLSAWRLEFRAKLVELGTAHTLGPVTLAAFVTNQGDQPSDPHSYANRQVIERLRKRLHIGEKEDIAKVSAASLRSNATAELTADTLVLENSGKQRATNAGARRRPPGLRS